MHPMLNIHLANSVSQERHRIAARQRYSVVSRRDRSRRA